MGLHHDHDHHGGHGHGHHHHHGPPPGGSRGRAFAVAVGLNSVFTVVEFAVGIASGSMALVADAGHNLSDVLSLLLAWGASVLAQRPPSARFTYGLKSSSILAAIANAALLWVALGAILLETIRRLAHPEPVHGQTMILVAAFGIVINAASAWLFARGRKDDLNVRAAFLHLVADAAVSAGVVLAGIAVVATGAAWIDPLASLLITAVIGWGSWGLLRDSVKMGLLAVPAGIDEGSVREFLEGQPGVAAVHDLHIWPMSTTETAITAHLTMPGGYPGDGFLHELAHDLDHRFGIVHPTFQVETEPDVSCRLEDEKVV
jgi:cobalt-zinc-cadmium efflux system protein